MISLDPRKFAEMFMGGRHGGMKTFDKDCFEEYVRVLKDPVAVHTMCEDYRASASIDMDEAREDIKKGRLIKCPVRVLWGKHGVIEKCFDALKEWREVAEQGVEVSGHNVDCGHYIPEQAPDVVVENIRELFS